MHAVTGADLEKHGELGRVIAGFHRWAAAQSVPKIFRMASCSFIIKEFFLFFSDLNFMTIHGKSRFPGLHIWLCDGTRIPVRIPGEALFLVRFVSPVDCQPGTQCQLSLTCSDCHACYQRTTIVG